MAVIVRRTTDSTELYAFLGADAGETAYALGDLDSPWWDKCEFWGGYEDDVLRGVVLYFYGFEIPTLLIHGMDHAVMAIMANISHHPEAFCVMPSRFRAVAELYYNTNHLYELYRMITTPESFIPVQRDQHILLRHLWAGDADRLNHLYSQAAEPGEAIQSFAAIQLEQGVFYGIEDAEGQLIAAAGTHVVSIKRNIAAVGNVFTIPSARRRGYGALTTAAVTQELFELGISRVVLNVKQHNEAAVHVYERLGFITHGNFIEGPMLLKSNPTEDA